MKNCKILELNYFEDERGKLVPLMDTGVLPFDVKRIYYLVHNENNIPRGNLCHKNLEQILLCVNGSCKVLLDDGEQQKTFNLDKYNKSLYISNGIWRKVYDFSPECIVLSINSELHDEKELIRDYEKFLNYKRTAK